MGLLFYLSGSLDYNLSKKSEDEVYLRPFGLQPPVIRPVYIGSLLFEFKDFSIVISLLSMKELYKFWWTSPYFVLNLLGELKNLSNTFDFIALQSVNLSLKHRNRLHDFVNLGLANNFLEILSFI